MVMVKTLFKRMDNRMALYQVFAVSDTLPNDFNVHNKRILP